MKCVIGLLLILLSYATTAVGQNWEQFGGAARFKVDLSSNAARNSDLAKQWSFRVGDGLSSIVTDTEAAYAMSLEDTDSKVTPRSNRESLVALNIETGDVKWTYTYEAGWIDDQEAFGGRPRAPQATPAIIGDTIVTVGFTGRVHGLNRQTGEVRWQFDASADRDSTPVQFGFSASVVPFDDQALVLVGGEKAGMLCLNAESGEEVWNIPCGEASYATPVLWRHPQGVQVVFQDREQLIGVSAESGEVLWRWELPKSGLTNVPTPLPVGDTGLIVSGQGVGGTARLDIRFRDGQWSVDEMWRNRTEFFYCNWVEHDDQIIGCNGKFLVVISSENGKLLAKWRGFAESNLVVSPSGAWVLDGDGKLSCLKFGPERWSNNASYQLFSERCWTPPTFSGNLLFCRAGKQLICYRLLSQIESKPTKLLTKLTDKRRELKLLSANATEASSNFVQQIVDKFEEDDPTMAFEEYEKIREKERQSFKISGRRQLMELAASEGYYRFARQIAADTKKDFPNEERSKGLKIALSKLLRQPANQPETGENGLIYVEFAIENRSVKKIDTIVKGPERNGFSYGIPFPPGKSRIEKWPIGTKLYWAVDDEPGEVAITVEKEFAGKTLEINPNPNR